VRATALLLGAALTACGGAAGGPRDQERSARAARAEEQLPPLDGQVDHTLTVELAELLVANGATEHAVPMLQQALARKPEDARLHYLLGTVLRDRGVFTQAEAELREATRLAPDMAPAWSALGILHDLRREHPEAEKAHRKALSLDASVARFHNNLGFCLYLQQRYAEAVPAYEEATKRSPNAAQTFTNLGFAYAALGRDADAERMFRQAGGEAAALHNLALAHELRGNADKARDLYRRALASDPRLEPAQRALDSLDAPTERTTSP
jgi:Flp pilus assembly protein TadD